LTLLPEKSSNIIGKISFGSSLITILLSGTSSFVCDIDEKTLKHKIKNKNFNFFFFLKIENYKFNKLKKKKNFFE